MRRVRAWLHRLLDVIRASRRERDLSSELESHVQLHVDDEVRNGATPTEARRRALAALGGLEPTKERYRDRRGLPFLAETAQDVRYAARVLRRSPGFTITAVLTLAIGIGFNTAIFSLINAAMLAPLPVKDPDELVWVYAPESFAPEAFRYQEFHGPFSANTDLFAGVAAVGPDTTTFRIGVDVERVTGEAVSGNYFEVLGIAPRLGRALSPTDDRLGADPVVVISDSLWHRRFNGEPTVIGQPVDLRWSDYSRMYTVVGVMAPGFAGTSSPWEPPEYWVSQIPRREHVQASALRFFRNFSVDVASSVLVGRRQPGATLEQVQTFANLWGHSVNAKLPRGADTALTIRESRLVRLPFDPRARVPPAWMAGGIMVVASFVLLIGISNLASLMLARGLVRRREVALRLTLGAGRWRLLRQLTTEGLLLAMAGTAAGLVASVWLVSMAMVGLPAGFQTTWAARASSIGVPLDWRVLIFTALTGMTTGVLVGLTPVRQAWRTNLLDALGAGTMAAPRLVRARIRHWAVVPQVALALALLVAAGVAVAELAKVALRPSGYQPARAVFVEVDMYVSLGLTRTREEKATFYQRVLTLAEGSPVLESVALANGTPVRAGGRSSLSTREDRDAGINHRAAEIAVTPNYFAILGIPLLAGRNFRPNDSRDGPLVGIIDADSAARLWPGQNAIGRVVTRSSTTTPRPQWIEIVGVAGSVRGPMSEASTAPVVYVPFEQYGGGDVLVARARGTEGAAIQALKQAIAAADPQVGVMKSGTLLDEVNRARHPRRLAVALLGFSGLVGLVLACLGVYGVVSYSIAQRLQELGIRVALGADRRDIIRLVLREGVRTALVAMVLGLVLAFSVTRIAASLVVNMPSTNPAVFIAAPAVLAAMVMLACYLSARRAAHVDPIAVLKVS